MKVYRTWILLICLAASGCDRGIKEESRHDSLSDVTLRESSDERLDSQRVQELKTIQDELLNQNLGHLPGFQILDKIKRHALMPSAVTAELLGRQPVNVLAYLDDFIIDEGESLAFKCARGFYGRGENIVAFSALNLDAPEEGVQSQDIPPVPIGYCPLNPRVGGEGKYTDVNIDISSLAVGCYLGFVLSDAGEASRGMYFRVENQSRIESADVILVYPNYTWTAYNSFGGGSLYERHHMQDGALSRDVWRDARFYSAALQRPIAFGGLQFPGEDKSYEFFAAASDRFTRGLNKDYSSLKIWGLDGNLNANDPLFGEALRSATAQVHNPIYSRKFLTTMEENGFRVAAVTNHDIHSGVLLEARDDAVLCLAGHDEYWTEEIWKGYENWLKAGRRIVNFSGNAGWGRVKVVDNVLHLSQEGLELNIPEYREYFEGTGFHGFHVFPGTETLLGVAWRFGGYACNEYRTIPGNQMNDDDPRRHKYSPLEIRTPEHPVFAGIEIAGGKLFAEFPAISLEIDGCPMTPEGRVDERFFPQIECRTTILASSWLYSPNLAYCTEGKEEYFGLKEAGVVVEHRPKHFSEDAIVISFSSMTFGVLLFQENRAAELLFLNALNFVKNHATGPSR